MYDVYVVFLGEGICLLPLTVLLQMNGIFFGLPSHINISELKWPGTPMTSVFEGQSAQPRPFPTKTRVIWVLGSSVLLYRKNLPPNWLFKRGPTLPTRVSGDVIPVSIFTVSPPRETHGEKRHRKGWENHWFYAFWMEMDEVHFSISGFSSC